jgi:Double zinc ribbon
MTDLERLFRRLVDNLIAIDPARLHRPLALGDLLGSVIPYRTTRRALGIDSAEDYDMLVLRLCAGEGGFVRLTSDDVGQVFRDQLTSPNPDLGLLREFSTSELLLGTEPLAHALGPGPEEAYAPPEEEYPEAAAAPAPPPVVLPIEPARRMPFTAEPVPPMVPPVPRMTAEPEPQRPPTLRLETGPRCSYCGGKLPSGRPVNFCPHCGQSQTSTRCPECQAELELGWRHCINCGHPVGEG